MARLTVTPRNGRDYKSRAAAIADWEAGLDFTSCGMDSYGLAVNKEDAVSAGFDPINIRYKKQTEVAVWSPKKAKV